MATAKYNTQNWYPLAFVVLAIPQTWLGGWLATRRYGRSRARRKPVSVE
jgi:hypothetical protein